MHKDMAAYLRPAALCAAILTFGVLSGAARAQFGGDRVEGVIVDIRADIVQVRPRFSTRLTRVVLDDRTRIESPQMIGVNKLASGMRVFGMGDWDGKTTVQAKFMMTADERTGFFSMKSRAIMGNSYGDGVMFAGTLKSLNPCVVEDDYGKQITVTVGGFVPVLRQMKIGREALLAGKQITAMGEKTTDGLLHARTIQIQQFPGDAGVVHGEVVAVHGTTIEVRPRFSEETIMATLAEGATVQQHLPVDPDGVKVGDALTAQGRVLRGSAKAPMALVASILVVGQKTYPSMPSGGFFGMMQGGAEEGQATGRVVSLAPFVLETADGRSVTVTIPGQTRVADLRAASLSDAKVGDKIMLIGSEGKEGGMVAKMVVIGAPPPLGFGGG